MKILGINSVFHDGSVCLLNGDCLIAVEEERFNGIRHAKETFQYKFPNIPFHSIYYCLEHTNTLLGEINHFAYSFDPYLRYHKKLLNILLLLLKGKIDRFLREIIFSLSNKRIYYSLIEDTPRKAEMRKYFYFNENPKRKFHFIEHHIAHAASAFYVSPFEKAAILSIDGIGEHTCTLLACGKGNLIYKIRETNYPHSLGFFYEEITKFLGFQRNHDEYKIMALAGFGKPRYYDSLRRLIRLKPNGEYEVNINFNRSALLGVQEFQREIGKPRLWEAPINQFHMDVASSAQKVLEDTVLHILEYLYNKTKLENLCMAGGVALNCVMNERIRRESRFKNIFIQPAANDAGTSLGAALWVYHSILNKPRRYIMKDIYLGPEYSNSEIRDKLENAKISYYLSNNITYDCAKLISEGKIIGWFQGKMEWGPRALGNRSILADPRNPNVKNMINLLKGREEFRPLAPVILEDYLNEYFQNAIPSPFMLFSFKVKEEKIKIIPAVVHVDGTARAQTVNEKQNLLLYNLITEFMNITGIPVLINTSLNYAGKPIVCTIEQALDCFYNSGIEYLAIGNCLISK